MCPACDDDDVYGMTDDDVLALWERVSADAAWLADDMACDLGDAASPGPSPSPATRRLSAPTPTTRGGLAAGRRRGRRRPARGAAYTAQYAGREARTTIGSGIGSGPWS